LVILQLSLVVVVSSRLSIVFEETVRDYLGVLEDSFEAAGES
jgi:hypothetical protein